MTPGPPRMKTKTPTFLGRNVGRSWECQHPRSATLFFGGELLMSSLPETEQHHKIPTRLRWVLRYAETLGWKLFPVTPLIPSSWRDDPKKGRVLTCSCPDGPECSSPGKHPLA